VKLLLDTHVLLWAVGPDERLSATARQLIGDPDNEVCFSTVSIWEVAIKHGRGRATSR
jgi:PIN domain nuclease of toxin-antitoxin system